MVDQDSSQEPRRGQVVDGPVNLVVRRVKLARPLPPPDTIPRLRLNERLDEALRCSLTLVIGPAGFGKTTMLAGWAEQLATPVAWFSLDDDDNDLVHFVSHLLAALQGLVPEAGRATASLIKLPTLPSPSAIGIQLADELLDIEQPLIVVVDDFHLISDPRIHAVIEALTRFPPPSLHFVIGSRIDPPLPVSRIRGRGLLVELRARDLRFTTEEAQDFFAQVSNGNLSEEVVNLLVEHLEGWPAGLRLAWLAIRDRVDDPNLLDIVTGLCQGPVREYLIEEVLARQSEADAQFLINTSIVDRICAPLCEALMPRDAEPGWSQSILEDMARGNPFLAPLDHDGAWFRYHHLLRQVLQNRLRLRYGDTAVKELHQRASAWFAAQEMIDEAIDHALRGDDPATAANLVKLHFPKALRNEDWSALARWLRHLPDTLVQQHPELLVARAWCAELGANLTEVESSLEEIESHLRRELPEGDINREWLLTSVDTVRSAIRHNRLFHEDFPLGIAGEEIGALVALTPRLQSEIAALAASIEWIGSDGTFRERWLWNPRVIYRALALQAVGESATAITELRHAVQQHPDRTEPTGWGLVMAEGLIHLIDGQLSEAEIVARRLLRAATKGHLKESIAWGHWILGMVDYERNELSSALEHFQQVLSLGDHVYHFARFEGLLAHALLLQAMGRSQEAQIASEELIVQLELLDRRENMPAAASFRARIALMHGDLARAQEWLDDPISAPMHRRLFFVESPLLLRSWVLLKSRSDEDRAHAMKLLKHLRLDAEVAHRRWFEARVLALLALAYDMQGRPEAAFSTLQEAIAIASPRGLVRTFVDFGAEMEQLLRRFSRYSGSSLFVSQVLAAFPSSVTHAGSPALQLTADDELIERLSTRELEVLRLMQQQMTNQEIGDQLYISPLTVKRHSINIYGKLGVSHAVPQFSKVVRWDLSRGSNRSYVHRSRLLLAPILRPSRPAPSGRHRRC